MHVALADTLIAALEPLAAEHGLDLVTVEIAGEHRHRVVRVFLDREGGIDIDAIVDANPWISDALDQVKELSGPYTLEVSSPGIERVLRTREHFARFAGDRVTVRTQVPVEGRSRFTGQLRGIDGDDVVIQVDAETIRVPLKDIHRARLKADISAAAERGGDDHEL